MEIGPEVLDTAAADPASPAWDVIWKASCHQGTCDPASAVLLPWLAQTCTALSAHARVKAVILAGFIAVDADDAGRAEFAAPIAALRALATDGLSAASSDSMFVYLQQAVLGFDGDEVWGKELDHINDGEVDVQCPECEEELPVELDPEIASIEPGLSSALARHLHAQAVQANRPAVATALTYLFGRLSCPTCGVRFNVALPTIVPARWSFGGCTTAPLRRTIQSSPAPRARPAPHTLKGIHVSAAAPRRRVRPRRHSGPR